MNLPAISSGNINDFWPVMSFWSSPIATEVLLFVVVAFAIESVSGKTIASETLPARFGKSQSLPQESTMKGLPAQFCLLVSCFLHFAGFNTTSTLTCGIDVFHRDLQSNSPSTAAPEPVFRHSSGTAPSALSISTTQLCSMYAWMKTWHSTRKRATRAVTVSWIETRQDQHPS